MKKVRILQTTCALASLLMLAACTQDEGMDGNGSLLPEGKYPLQITGITMTALPDSEPWDASTDHAPQTRVSENNDGNSSVWTNNDVINVRIGSGTPSTYKVAVDGSGNVTGLNPTGTPLSWKNANSATVYGWYLYPTPTTSTTITVSLSDQTNSLAYVLFGKTASQVSYTTQDITITFAHKLAKIRVNLTGNQASLVNDVKVFTYPSCTFSTSDGAVTFSGTQAYIPMKKCTYGSTVCWEANVVPGSGTTKIKINGSIERELNGFNPAAAKVNTITLTAGKQ